MRVELVHHSLDGALDDLLVIDRLDVLVLDEDQDATELSEVAVGALVAAGGVGEPSRQRAPAEGSEGRGRRGHVGDGRGLVEPTGPNLARPDPSCGGRAGGAVEAPGWGRR